MINFDADKQSAMPQTINYAKTFESFKKLNILVVGDVMIDSYLFGKVERISPEAPVPVVSVESRENRLGGAANVALNIRAMGANPILCSVIGNDTRGEEFINLLNDTVIHTYGLYRSEERVTTTKYRIIGNNTQMLRVDEEVTHPLSQNESDAFSQLVLNILETEQIHCVIFQDYDKGVLTPNIIKAITTKANELNIPTTVDPKKRNFNAYKNVTLFKPNLKELREGLKLDVDFSKIENLENAVSQLQEKQNLRMVLATLSEQGVFISYQTMENGRKSELIPAFKRSIADVSGAGDTVISVASLCLAMNLPVIDVARISNLAGGLVCEYVGVVPVDPAKLLNELNSINL